jgi:hypothetical protein
MWSFVVASQSDNANPTLTNTGASIKLYRNSTVKDRNWEVDVQVDRFRTKHYT